VLVMKLSFNVDQSVGTVMEEGKQTGHRILKLLIKDKLLVEIAELLQYCGCKAEVPRWSTVSDFNRKRLNMLLGALYKKCYDMFIMLTCMFRLDYRCLISS